MSQSSRASTAQPAGGLAARFAAIRAQSLALAAVAPVALQWE